MQVWLEYIFGICRPDGRIGKGGSRSHCDESVFVICWADCLCIQEQARLYKPPLMIIEIPHSRAVKCSQRGLCILNDSGHSVDFKTAAETDKIVHIVRIFTENRKHRMRNDGSFEYFGTCAG